MASTKVQTKEKQAGMEKTALPVPENQQEELVPPPERMKRIEVHFTPASIDEESLPDKNVVVIDVLRSASSIAVALQNGAREIIPVGEMETAYKVFSNLTREVTLRCGERNGKMIQGFDLGNSPLTYTEEKVKGKSIVMLTTNGTAAIVKAKHAKSLLVASFLNLSSVVAMMAGWFGDGVIICSGQDQRFSIEDTICAGKILTELLKVRGDLQLDDSARSAMLLNQAAGSDLLTMMNDSDHGKHLVEMGFVDDLQFCATVDSIPVVPVLTGGVLKLNPDHLHHVPKNAT